MQAAAAPHTNVILHPESFPQTSPYDLLVAASRGRIGLDQRFLRAILDRPEESVPALVRFGLEDHSADPVPLEADLVAYFRRVPDPRALPFLIDCIRREPDNVEDDLLDAFCRQGSAAVDPLLALLKELGPENEEVPFILAGLQVRDPRILEALAGRLPEDPGEAAFNLGMYGDPAAIPELQAVLARLEAAGESTRWDVREVKHAIERLSDPEPPVEVEPLDICAEYPELEPPRFSILPDSEVLEFLQSPVAEYRSRAAESFRLREISDKAKTLLFERARTDSEASVRARCWESLGTSTKDPNVREAMLGRLSDTAASMEERCGALVGLAVESPDDAVRQWILELYEIPEARAKALEAMWRSLDRGFAEYFPRHLDDLDPAVKREAISGVGYLGIGSEASRLRNFFEDEEFRADALYAYALSAPGEVSRIRMRQLFNRIDEMAGGLSEMESVVVRTAIDDRLAIHDLPPLFSEEEGGDEESTPVVSAAKTGRNDPCPCGSGKKYKKCCGA